MTIPKMELYRTRRRFVRLAASDRDLFAVADDGTAWWMAGCNGEWRQVRALPDDVRFDEMGD